MAWSARLPSQEVPPADITFAYTLDQFANLEGGLERGIAVLGKADLSIALDGAALGAAGISVYANGQFVHGRALSGDLVGDAQVVSNIEAIPALRLFEAWVDFALVGTGIRLKSGLVDLNSEFDIQKAGSFFLNSSHGIGPDFSQSGRNGPSIFPTTATAVIARRSAGPWELKLGLFDSQAGEPARPRRTVIRFPGRTGLLMVGQVERTLGRTLVVRAGAWRYSDRFERVLPVAVPGKARAFSHGAFVTAESALGRIGNRPVTGWARIGLASPAANPIAATLSGGVVAGGDRLRAGIALSHARQGNPALTLARSAELAAVRSETNVELSMGARASDRLWVQPDVQVVFNPGFRGGEIAVAAGVRFRLDIE